MTFEHPILGQEAVCPDGLGRVKSYVDNFPTQYIEVETYVNNRGCHWAPHNVTLIPPGGFPTWYCGCGHTNGANLAVCATCGRMPNGEHP